MQTQATFTDDDSEYDSLPSLMIRGSNVSSSSDDTVSVELPSTNWINNGPASVPEAIDVFQCDLALTHDEVSIPSTHLRTSEEVPLTASEGRRQSQLACSPVCLLTASRSSNPSFRPALVQSHRLDFQDTYAKLLLSIEQGIRPSCRNSRYSIMATEFELNMRNATVEDEIETPRKHKEETKKVLGFKRVPFCLELNKETEIIQMGPKKCIDFACTNHPKAEDNTSKPIRFSQAGMVVPTLPNIFPDLPLVRLENGELTTTRTAFAGGIAIIGESGLCA